MQYQHKYIGGVFELSFNNTDLLIETCNYFCAFATKKDFFLLILCFGNLYTAYVFGNRNFGIRVLSAK